MTLDNKDRLKALGWPGLRPAPNIKHRSNSRLDQILESHQRLVEALDDIGGCGDVACMIAPPTVDGVRSPAGCTCVMRVNKIRAALRAYTAYRMRVAKIAGVQGKP